MNKSRRMAAIQSRNLARSGFDVLQIDLLGCGDSSGDFGDAGWQDWVNDVIRGGEWLQQRGDAPLWLWGLRAGCLLAVEAARGLRDGVNFVFWAPVVSGNSLLQQFLRLKAATDLASGNAKNVMGSLRDDLAAGRHVEIAGYLLAPAMARGLEQADLALGDSQAFRGRVEWLELSTRDEAQLTPLTIKTVAAWERAGATRLRSQLVHGQSFWQTTEIEDAPALIDATTRAMLEAGPP